MEKKELIKYLKKNDPALWRTIGKNINNPTVLVNELIRHYQWIFQMGDIDGLDLGDRINKNYKALFVFALENNIEFRDEFFNYILFVFKIAFDYNTKTWDKEVIQNILINNKRLFWFDYASMYTLIASSYDQIRPIIMNEFIVGPENDINKKYLVKLFDAIVNQKFFDKIKEQIKSERMKPSKNIYITK